MDIENAQSLNLKCSICKKYLNVAPVLTSEDGKINKCGRCQLKGPMLNHRNTLYESIGAKLTFPCINEECKERLTWHDVQRHERSCQFRKISCPFWNCREKDINFTLCNDTSHFENSHPGSVHKNNLNLSLSNILQLQSYMKLLIVNDLPYLIIVHCLKFGEMILIGVFNFDPKIYDYQIKMYSDKHSRRHIVFKERVLLYDECQHCLYCLQNLCTLDDHRYSKKYPETQKDKYKFYAKVDTLCTKTVLLTENIMFDIDIIENKDVK